ncbi:pyruvate kinase [Haematobia irritans]|uniref:pyruvate kinase n=1 Tax=Haematobia irritans TaxID=7368 RepID=UPI003F4FC5FC
MEEEKKDDVFAIDFNEELCKKLSCSIISNNKKRRKNILEILAEIQDPNQKEQYEKSENNCPSNENISSEDSIEDGEEEECSKEAKDLISDDEYWQDAFEGFEIIRNNEIFFKNPHNQCVQISCDTSSSMLISCLRAGIRCFLIDFFEGNEININRVICKLHREEVKLSQEYGFPVHATVMALISPHCPYTGIFYPPGVKHQLHKGEEIILTPNRDYALSSSREKVYVNAFSTCRQCQLHDFIFIGPSLQIKVIDIDNDLGDLRCEVMEGGFIGSRFPMRFPGKYNRFDLTYEEGMNIELAYWNHVHTLVSYTPGSRGYFEKFKEYLSKKSKDIRLYSRLVLNEISDNDCENIEWIVDSYDGFLFDFTQIQEDCPWNCNVMEDNPNNEPKILELSATAVNLIKKIYQLQKPIIINPQLFAKSQLFVHPCNRLEIFYYPDKYIFRCDQEFEYRHFSMLQDAMITRIRQSSSFGDDDKEESNILARSIIRGSIESNTAAIIVCSPLPDMAIKLSHFRPKAPIVFISSTKSLIDYISIYHHITFLYFGNNENIEYREWITKAINFALMSAKISEIVKQGQDLFLVYGYNPGNPLLDKFVIYKFDKENYSKHLKNILF